MPHLSTYSKEINGIFFQVREPIVKDHQKTTLMLHGWTGDEHAMWIFASRLPATDMLLAPRGLFRTAHGGFSWHSDKVKSWPWVDDFQPAVEALLEAITPQYFPGVDINSVRMVGFSQGAALAFSFALLNPKRVSAVAALSGFLPDGAQALARNKPLSGKDIFVTHGTQDHLVPVERARDGVNILQMAGAQVTYCEDNVGHKLSRNCFRGLQGFFEGL